jgi:hypothetical protein
MSVQSVQNTKQALEAIFDLMIVMIPKFHDGVQIQDFVEVAAKIMNDEELKAKMLAAYNDIELVPKELGDLQTSEIIELVSLIITKVPMVLEALRK